MSSKITDLESIIEPISLLFRRAKETGHPDVRAPNNMHFGDNNAILLSWNLTSLPPEEADREFARIHELAQADFTMDRRDNIGIVIFTARIIWHGDYPDVHFKVFMPIAVIK